MRNFFLIVLCCMVYYAKSQVYISGTIEDANTHEKITGVNVYIPELNKGTISDTNGKYQLEHIPQGFLKIQFSHIGYKTVVKTLNMYNEKVVLNIALENTFIESEEVIVTAGGISTQHQNAIKIETYHLHGRDDISSGSLINDITSVPGVYAISKGSGVITPVIRGLSTTNLILVNNGVRMENFQFSENHPFLIDESTVDRIEIIKGPASLLYGSDAIGGVLNLISEKPAPTGKIKGSILTTYNTNTAGINTGAGLKGTQKDISWGLRGNIKSYTDFTDGNHTIVPNSRYNTRTFSVFSGIHKHFGALRMFYTYNQMDLGMTVPDVIDEITSNNRRNEVWYQNLDNHLFITKGKLFLNRWTIETDFSYQKNHRKLNTVPANEHYTAVDMSLHTIGYQARTVFNISETTKYIVGYQGMFQKNRNADTPSRVLPDYSLCDNSLYTLYQATISKKLNMQSGIRFDMRNYDVPEQEKSAHSHEEPHEEDEDEHLERLTRQYGNISASGGVIYSINDDLMLRGNIAMAYRTPHISELTQDGIHGTRYETGDRSLKSQRNYETDISIHYHSEKLKYDLAVFYNFIEHYIFLAPTADTTEDGHTVYAYRQENAVLYGLESGIEYYFLSWFSLKCTFSNVTGKQTSNRYLPFIPQDKLSFSFKMKKKSWKFLVDLYLFVQTDIVFDQIHPSEFETKTAGFNLVNMGSGFTIKSGKIKALVKIQINNLFDVRYIDHLSTLKGMGFYNMGRNISLHLGIPFELR